MPAPEAAAEPIEESKRSLPMRGRLRLRFVDAEGRDFGLSITTGPTTALAKYFEQLCAAPGLQASQVRRWSGRCGRSIKPGHSAGSLNLIDGDRIFVEDVGDSSVVAKAIAARLASRT